MTCQLSIGCTACLHRRGVIDTYLRLRENNFFAASMRQYLETHRREPLTI